MSATLTSGQCKHFKFTKYKMGLERLRSGFGAAFFQLQWKIWKRVRKRHAAQWKPRCPHEQAIQWANTRKNHLHSVLSYALTTTLNYDDL